MVLTRDRILAEMDEGHIAIDPWDRDMLGPASVDLHLGEEIRVLDVGPDTIELCEDADYRDFSRTEYLAAPYPLLPGRTVLGITRERIRLASDICGWLEGRSRFARLGLMVHATAGFVSPGIDNRQVLEISNLSGRVLNIHPHTRICQMVFQRTEGTAVYHGRFVDQTRP